MRSGAALFSQEGSGPPFQDCPDPEQQCGASNSQEIRFSEGLKKELVFGVLIIFTLTLGWPEKVRTLGELCLFFLEILFMLFLHRGEGREKERERNISGWLPLMCPLLGTWPETHRKCVLTGNRTRDPVVRRPVLNPLSRTGQGELCLLV